MPLLKAKMNPPFCRASTPNNSIVKQFVFQIKCPTLGRKNPGSSPSLFQHGSPLFSPISYDLYEDMHVKCSYLAVQWSICTCAAQPFWPSLLLDLPSSQSQDGIPELGPRQVKDLLQNYHTLRQPLYSCSMHETQQPQLRGPRGSQHWPSTDILGVDGEQASHHTESEYHGGLTTVLTTSLVGKC